jgi:excisionase family DNA binding protein
MESQAAGGSQPVALPKVAQGRAPRFYRVAEVAELLGLSEPTVYRAIRSRELPAIKVRGAYVIPAKAIDQMESDALFRLEMFCPR